MNKVSDELLRSAFMSPRRPASIISGDEILEEILKDESVIITPKTSPKTDHKSFNLSFTQSQMTNCSNWQPQISSAKTTPKSSRRGRSASPRVGSSRIASPRSGSPRSGSPKITLSRSSSRKIISPKSSPRSLPQNDEENDELSEDRSDDPLDFPDTLTMGYSLPSIKFEREQRKSRKISYQDDETISNIETISMDITFQQP